jgi:[acyl-carrier-protein] S-malonyltransferase
MGQDLVAASPAAAAVFDEVGEALGLDIRKLCWDTDAETLRQTQNAQVALFATGVAAFRALQEAHGGWTPQAMAGHSVGEYAALVSGGWLSVATGAKLVRRRGEIMAASGKDRPGTMAAVLGMERAALEALCDELSQGGQIVVIANDNSPGQLVVSGDVNAVQALSASAGERGAKRVLPLNVSGAFHSPLMKEGAAALAEALSGAEFQAGTVPVVSNVTAQPETDWPARLAEQMVQPVRWTETVQGWAAQGLNMQVECGHGEVLGGLLRRIAPEVAGARVVDSATLQETVKKLGGAP